MGYQENPYRSIVSLFFETLGTKPGKVKPRENIIDQDNAITVNLPDPEDPIDGIRNGHNGIGICIIDIPRGQNRVQNCLQRGRGRGWVFPVREEFSNHLGVGQGRKLAKSLQKIQRNRRKARRIDELKILSAPLHAEDFF